MFSYLGYSYLIRYFRLHNALSANSEIMYNLYIRDRHTVFNVQVNT